MTKNMKRAIIGTLFILITAMAIILPRVAESRVDTNVPADISEEELKAVVVVDFEKDTVNTDTGWNVTSTPKKYTSAETEKKLKRSNPVPVLEAKIINGGPNDMRVEEWSLTGLGKTKGKCLGVHFKFRYPGVNSVHLIPPKELEWKEKTPVMRYNPSLGKEVQEPGIQLPGRAKGISLWVHGRGHPYNLEVWLKDYRGDTHILKMGSVNFIGWRPLKAYVPESVPQSDQSYPQTRLTRIVRLVLRADTRAHSEELEEETFFFFDQIKVLTDTYEVNFDGMDLHKVFRGESGEAPK